MLPSYRTSYSVGTQRYPWIKSGRQSLQKEWRQGSSLGSLLRRSHLHTKQFLSRSRVSISVGWTLTLRTRSHKVAHNNLFTQQNIWPLKCKLEGNSRMHVLRSIDLVLVKKEEVLCSSKSHTCFTKKKKGIYAECCAGNCGLRFTNHDPTVSL